MAKNRFWAKKYQIQRTEKNGEIRYFQGGKRISDKEGRRKYIQQNYEQLIRPFARKVNLSEEEQRTLRQSQSQKNLFTWKGKPQRKIVTELLKATKIIPENAPRELTKLIDPDTGKPVFQTYGAFEQRFVKARDALTKSGVFLETELGAPSFRNRDEAQSIVSLFEQLKIIGYDGWNIVVRDAYGVHQGLEKAMEAIRKYELGEMTAALGEGVRNIAFMSFTYKVEYDFKKKRVIVDTSQAEAKVKTSDPKRRTDQKHQKATLKKQLQKLDKPKRKTTKKKTTKRKTTKRKTNGKRRKK